MHRQYIQHDFNGYAQNSSGLSAPELGDAVDREAARIGAAVLLGAPLDRNCNLPPEQDPLVIHGLPIFVITDGEDYYHTNLDAIALFAEWDEYRLHLTDWVWTHEWEGFVTYQHPGRSLETLCGVIDSLVDAHPRCPCDSQPVDGPVTPSERTRKFRDALPYDFIARHGRRAVERHQSLPGGSRQTLPAASAGAQEEAI